MRAAPAWFVIALLGCGGGAAGPDAADAPSDTAGTDARSDAAPADVASDAPAACVPTAVSFPQGGTLAPGTLCDELYACATDAADAARIQAASPRFSCVPGSEPGSGCTSYTCAYRNPGGPSTLDESEIADICALTVLTPPPPLRCAVFVNAS
jgi:hypothetical protein